MITFEDIKKNNTVRTYIEKADESLIALGFTEHSYAHVTKVAVTAKEILEALKANPHDIELAQIAAYLHDIGNVVNRLDDVGEKQGQSKGYKPFNYAAL